jgi:hypothetical protein
MFPDKKTVPEEPVRAILIGLPLGSHVRFAAVPM